ncbi:MAG TPA: biopolymer transporter ExbD [Candidatus Krumholzibacteria bacterium]|jgi:biopolymer transport protein ExbD|nr:biopolymer transporter ExbD [Candidatus Krumholzibacteria bacterium]
MKRSPYSSMADINVTSLVDIMMVLLIIFMLTSQYIQSGIQLKLPKAQSTVIKETDAITISVAKDRKIYINDDVVKNVDQVSQALKTLKATGESRVYVRADEGVPYGIVMEVIGEVKSAGITDVGMITEKKQ